MTASAIVALGVDGYPRGWVAVRLEDGAFARAEVAKDLAALLTAHQDAAAVGVDMPIGLPALGATRPCDAAARAFLGLRRSSIFPAPPAEVLARTPHAEASALSVERSGKGISRQAYALKEKIAEVQPLAERDPRVLEVHPECSFTAMARAELRSPKTSWDGLRLRERLLRDAGVHLPEDLGAAGMAPPADVLDAAAAAWTAHRYAIGAAEPFPAGARPGERMVIWR